MPLPNNNSQKAPHHHDANNPSLSSLSSKSPRQPTLTNPLVHFPIQTLFELPNLITDEEATRLIHALDKAHFGKEWTNEGFDRRHRVQRYHYRHGHRHCDSDAGSEATHTNENFRGEHDGEEEHHPPPPSVEESFGWIFDRILSASSRDPIDNAAKGNDIDDDETTNDSTRKNEQESRMELPTPMEVIVTEHTPTSCRSQVNVFEQNEYCTCWKEEKRQQQLQKQNSSQNEKDIPMERRQQRQNPRQPIPPKCTCYIAQLTLLGNAVQSIEKPMERTPSCWDVAEPSQLHETNVLMEQNGVVVKTGECLWEWRGRISDIGAVQELWDVDGDAASEGPSKSATDNISLKKQESGASVPAAVGKMATFGEGEERKSKSAPSSGNGAWQRLKKLNSVNKRCITVTFRSIQNTKQQQRSSNGQDQEWEEQQSQSQNEGEEGTKFEKPPHLPLSQLLTIIVTTSPIRSHPSTEMLEKTFDTFPYAGEEFAYECRKVIVCDGCRVRDEEEDGSNNSNGANSRRTSCDSATTSNSNQSFSNISNNNDNRNKKEKNNINGINSGSNHSESKPTITRKHANIKQALRSGIATVDQAKNYIEFKSALRKLCEDATRAPYPRVKSPFRNAEVVELEERHGYGFALRHALVHCIDTPYVCVIQHDRTFMRPTPVAEVVDAMRNDPTGKIKYVGMSMKSNLMYYDIFGGKYGKKAIDELRSMILRPESLCIRGGVYGPNGSSSRHMTADSTKVRKNLESLVETYRGSMQYITYKEWLQSVGRSTTAGAGGGRCGNVHQNCHQLSLTPTLFWYDNTHIVQTSHYRDFVFDPKYKMVARGGFVEDKLSPAMIRNVERFGLREGHGRFGCYLLDDHSGMFFTGHLDGGGYLTADEKDKIQKSIGGKKES